MTDILKEKIRTQTNGSKGSFYEDTVRQPLRVKEAGLRGSSAHTSMLDFQPAQL